MHHLYISFQPCVSALEQERMSLVAWCKENGISTYGSIEEKLFEGRVSSRMLTKLLSPVSDGDTVVAVSLSRLGRSLKMMTNVIRAILERNAYIQTLKGDRLVPGKDAERFLEALDLAIAMDAEIKGERSNEALSKARDDGKTLGRPVGSKKSEVKSVLYGKTELLDAMLEQGKSKAEIAHTLNVARSTVFNYVKAKEQRFHSPE